MTTNYKRIAVIGLPGSGKSTLSTSVSKILNLQHIELDAIHWQPNWVSLQRPVMSEQVSAACPPDGHWVVDGNYRVVRPITWGRAEILIWLDIPLWLSMWRLLKRTLSRIFFRTRLWNGNRERWRNLFALNKEDSILLFAMWQSRVLEGDVSATLRGPEYRHLKVLRFRGAEEVEGWLRSLRRDKVEEDR